MIDTVYRPKYQQIPVGFEVLVFLHLILKSEFLMTSDLMQIAGFEPKFQHIYSQGQALRLHFLM